VLPSLGAKNSEKSIAREEAEGEGDLQQREVSEGLCSKVSASKSDEPKACLWKVSMEGTKKKNYPRGGGKTFPY